MRLVSGSRSPVPPAFCTGSLRSSLPFAPFPPVPRNFFRCTGGRKSRGTTLLELVIATGLICILALLCVVATRKSLNGARRAECVSNLRQIMAGAILFANEHNGCFPVTDDPASGIRSPSPPSNTGLMDQLLPYINNHKLFYCADRRSGTYSYPVQNARTSQRFRQMGYYWACTQNTAALKLTPSLPQKLIGSGGRGMMSCLTGLGGIPDPHDGSVNIAFADGHVASLPKPVRLGATYFDPQTLLLKDKYK